MKALLKGTEYNLVKMPRLPKRAGSVGLIQNGNPIVAPVTTNRGWNTDAKFILSYIWLEHGGIAYYLTLDYAVPASDFAGEEVTVTEGKAKRSDPKRVTNKVATEAGRIEKFKITYAARA